MEYTVSTTHDGRRKVTFTSPYQFSVVQPKTPEGMASSYRLSPDQRAAARAFLESLTDDQLAAFASAMVGRMDELESQIGRYDRTATDPVFHVHTPEPGCKLLTGVWPNPYLIDLRFTSDGGFDVCIASIFADAEQAFDLFAAQCGESNYGFCESELASRALELAAEITGS